MAPPDHDAHPISDAAPATVFEEYLRALGRLPEIPLSDEDDVEMGCSTPDEDDSELECSTPEDVKVDRSEMERFVRALFCNARPGGWVCLRSFEEERFFRTKWVQIPQDRSLDDLIDAAFSEAEECNRPRRNIVFCPPIATFKHRSAKMAALANGLVLTVECDQHPLSARDRLEAIIGPATMVVESGGRTAEGEPKLHLHWVLKTPTRTPEQHKLLQRARSLACDLAGADVSSKSPVHPLRWAGSVHRKAAPILTKILFQGTSTIELTEAVAALEKASNDAGHPERLPAVPNKKLTAPIEKIARALDLIPNEERNWEFFNQIGMATYAATGGSEEGFALFDGWAEKLPGIYNPTTTRERWEHYHSSPPRKIGAGTLFHLAGLTRAAELDWDKADIDGAFDNLDLLDGPLTTGSQELLPGDNWQSLCSTTKAGGTTPNLANVMRAFRGEPQLRNILAYNEMSRSAVLFGAVPRFSGAPAVQGPFPRAVTDTDISAFQEYLQDLEFPRLNFQTTYQAIEKRAQENPFHPVRDYLNGLIWDGEPRISGGISETEPGVIHEAWLTKYLGVEENAYTMFVGQAFLISMVARIFQPGCKVDHVMIFEGAQGEMKSTVFDVLAAPWFSDNLPENIKGKDAALLMRDKWLIELGELVVLSRTEVADLKAFITRRIEQYRPPYGIKMVEEPRQCIFIGTGNKKEYLRDETGGRRFWPVEVAKTRSIDIQSLKRVRDQLFAEAVHLYLAKVPWWPDRDFESRYMRPEQEARYEADAWEESIAPWLEALPLMRVLISEVALRALNIQRENLSKSFQIRIANILERLGWCRAPRSAVGRYWIPNNGMTDDANDAL